MFEFKKSKSSEKVLTEKEIQQKLYGRFLHSNDTAGASEPVGKPAHAAAPAASTTSLFPEARDEDLSKESLAEGVSQIHPFEKKTEFREPGTLSTAGDKTREKSRSAEGDAFRSVPRPKRVQASEFQTEKSKTAFRMDLKKVFEKGADGIVSLVRGLSRIFSGASRMVDLRRDGVRTGISWGGGALVLVLLLIAIHGLNAKRELAMKKTPIKQRQVMLKTAKKNLKTKHDKEESKTTTVTTPADQVAETAIGTLPQESPLKPVDEDQEQVRKKKEALASKREMDRPVSKGRFVIQVATYVIKDDANGLMEDLKKSEPRVFVKGLTRASGKTYYSVFIGRFKTFQDAQQAVAGFKKTDLARSFKDAFIRTLDS